MKTKIVFSIIAISILTAAAAVAQDKGLPAIYLKVYGGYSLFSAGSDNVTGSNSNLVDPIVSPATFKQSKLGAGSGANYGFGIAAPLSKLWTAGIDVNYLRGSKLTFVETGTIYKTSIKVSDYITASHSVLSVIPNITYKILPMTNYFVYTRLGLMLAAKTKSQYDNVSHEFVEADDDAYLKAHADYKYGLNLGLQSALGAQFKITKRLSVFCELSGNFLTVKPTSALSTLTYPGVNADGTLNTIVQINHTNFKKASSGTINFQSTTTTGGNVVTINNTSDAVPFPEHINSIVINAGLVFGF